MPARRLFETSVADRVFLRVNSITDSRLVRNARNSLRVMLDERSVKVWGTILLAIIIMGVIGPFIAPYEPSETVRTESGMIAINEAPSAQNLLGTTSQGYDVLSRILYGARPTVVTGALGGSILVIIGGLVGITAGYVGGRTDDFLMRMTDLAYGIPLIPTALVLVAVFGAGFLQSIVVIGLLIWRGMARVLRSQVLQIRERPFVTAAKATGASTSHIIFKHILPNVGTMVILFFALGVGYSILIQAGLAFLGVADASMPSWGIMVRNAQTQGRVSASWWWSLPPGLLVSLTVMATFMFGRSYEKVVGQSESSDEALAQGG